MMTPAERRARKIERMIERDRAARISFDPHIIAYMIEEILRPRGKVDFGGAYQRQEIAAKITHALKTVGALR